MIVKYEDRHISVVLSKRDVENKKVSSEGLVSRVFGMPLEATFQLKVLKRLPESVQPFEPQSFHLIPRGDLRRMEYQGFITSEILGTIKNGTILTYSKGSFSLNIRYED